MAEETIDTQDVQDVQDVTDDLEVTPASGQATATESEDGNAPLDTEATETTRQPSRAQTRIRELVDRAKEAEGRASEAETGITQLQKQLEDFQAKYAPPQAKQHPLSDHPALRGQAPDEDGQVWLEGRWQNADVLIAKHEAAETRRMLEEFKSGQKQAELDAKRERERQELGNATYDLIRETREATYAGLDTDRAGALDKWVAGLIGPALDEAERAGKLTPETIEHTVNAAFTEAKQLFGALGVAQLADNEKYKAQNKVKPGTPGAKAAKSIHEMSKAEIDRMSGEWVRQAEEMKRRA